MTSSTPPPPDRGDEQPPPPLESAYPSYSAPDGGMPAYPQGSEPATQQMAPPQSILTAVKLMWAGAVLSAIGLVVGLLTLGSLKDNIRDQLAKNNKTFTQSDINTAYNITIGSIIVIGVLGIGLWLWMAWANGNGRKWARIVATVLGGVNVLLTLVSLAQSRATAGSVILSVISAVLAIIILVLLWRKESSDYYLDRSQPRFG
jgi:hypothetical protein